MRAELFRPEHPDQVVAAAWPEPGGRVRIDAEDASEDVRAAVRRIFRLVPVTVDDAALRSFGTHGPSVLEPGDLRWFAAAARTRSGAEGLAVRFVPGADGAMGWDPAGAYRTFQEAVERRDRLSARARGPGTARASH